MTVINTLGGQFFPGDCIVGKFGGMYGKSGQFVCRDAFGGQFGGGYGSICQLGSGNGQLCQVLLGHGIASKMSAVDATGVQVLILDDIFSQVFGPDNFNIRAFGIWMERGQLCLG